MPYKHASDKIAHDKEYNSRPDVKLRNNYLKREKYASGGSVAKKEYDAKRRQTAEYKQQRSAYMIERRRTAWAKVKLREIVCKCKKHGIPFNLTEDDLILPDVCPIFGTKIEIGLGKQTNNSPSVDRVIPNLGYVRGNVVVVSNRANSLKKSATLSELVAMVQFYFDFSNQNKEK